MKFDSLYKQVFIAEAVVGNEETEVADPANFDDVEPMPLPEPTEEQPVTPAVPETPLPAVTTSTLTDYIKELEDFANKLNSADGDSLQSLVSKLDKVETPFEGIYSRTSAEIVDAAKTLRSVSEKIKSFIIHAAKK